MLLKKESGLNDNSYHEASVVRPPARCPLQGHVHADICVVGGGYAGLSSALELAQRGFSVALLEARRIGSGASGRNGGQVLPGYAGQAAMERQLPREDAHRAWDISIEAVQLLQERITHCGIDCDYTPGCMTLATSPRKARDLDAFVDHLACAYGYPMQWIGAAEIREWIASEQFHAGAFDPHAGHLHPLKYCLGLALAGMAGRMVAEAVAGHAERFDLLGRIRHAPFPRGGWIRQPAVALGVLYYRLRDLL